MPDIATLRRQPDIAGALPADDAFAAALLPPMARFALRGDADVASLAGAAFGMPLPLRPLGSSAVGVRASLWLGPDEWLLLAPLSEQSAVQRQLAPALAGRPHSLVEISHRQVALMLAGRLAARVLSSGCPLDLSLGAFPVGAVTRTLFHKAEIVLWRQADGFHVEVWRSFAPYVAGHLAAARQGAEGL
jgi:sarcosine oxidase, subunit gamma